MGGDDSFIENILANAIKARASDIHFEPDRDSFGIRFRIDGLLYFIERFKKHEQEKIISKIKVLAKMDIMDHRLPQDGHFEYQYQGKMYNIRVSSLPSSYGEALVFRLLNRENILMKIEGLGFSQDQLELVNKLSHSPSGMILTTGPSGAGKTTLLYALLHSLAKPEKNIVSLEDPVEFYMPGIRQAQIDEGIGLTFSKALRSVVRQDPDVVMLGEIRDPESAQLAIQASLTGILIFSSFHTFDIPALVARLSEMGLSSSVVAQSIQGVIATRLLRKICPSCQQEYQPNEFEMKVLNIGSNQPLKKGRGCESCQQSGYFGRTGIYEVVYFDDEIRSSIIEKKPVFFLHELLQKKKLKTFKDCAIEKVIKGETTVEEAVRIIGFFPFFE